MSRDRIWVLQGGAPHFVSRWFIIRRLYLHEGAKRLPRGGHLLPLRGIIPWAVGRGLIGVDSARLVCYGGFQVLTCRRAPVGRQGDRARKISITHLDIDLGKKADTP